MISQELLYTASHILDRFCVAGINHCQANTVIRGLFAVDQRCYEMILHSARNFGLKSVFVLSTCNRTEIYGYTYDMHILVELLTSNTNGSKEEFLRHAYIKSGENALDHLYRVAAGMDSQILGDYEILGQLKRAVEFARQNGTVGPILDRTLNFVIRASKQVKKNTSFSSGTVSVSYAVVELLKEMPEIADKKVLLVGAGKTGKSVCKNLKRHLKINSIKVLNRTEEAAQALAIDLNITYDSFSRLPVVFDESDIIILCTNAESPIILPEHITANCRSKLVIDLSVPVNVHSEVKRSGKIKIVDVDDISDILNKTLAEREAEIPRTNHIMDRYKNEFLEWLDNYKDMSVLRFWKNQLVKLNQTTVYNGQGLQYKNDSVKYAQKAIKRLAISIREQDRKGCLMIHMVNEYLEDVQPLTNQIKDKQ